MSFDPFTIVAVGNAFSSSLDSLVESFQFSNQAYQSAESSLQYADDPQWKNTLGSKEEIEFALQASQQGLETAADAFTQEDIAKAKKANLISNSEMQKLIQLKRSREMQTIRQQANPFNQDGQKQ